MKKIIWLLVCLLLYSTYTSRLVAYELNGTMNDNNDGTYAVTLTNENGEQYLGLADMQGDGTLTVNVAIQGGGNEIYIGNAVLNNDGTYTLSLRNNESGKMATGTLVIE